MFGVVGVSHATTTAPTATAGATEATTPDTDNIQSGDQTTPDLTGATDTAAAASETAAENASDTETGAAEAALPNGGFADTSNNADTQQEGVH